ncbi:MAG: dihydrofolate reductase family protein, partial [Plesiomonas sp.]
VLSSAETVLADGASLTVRWDELPPSVKASYPKETLRQPLRVIVDSQNRLTPDLPLFQSESPVLLARHKASGEWPEWVHQLELPLLDGKLDLVSLFMLLAKQNVNSVLVEAGPRLCGALLEKGLVDELVLYQAPKLMGDEGRGLFHLPGLTRLFQAPKLAIKDVRMVGPDIRITAKIA